MARVLVIDDNVDSRLLVNDLLTVRGFEVAAVSSGREALQTLPNRPADVIILDLQMPEMDGFATLAALRELESSADTPVIVMSAHVLPEDQRRMQAAGFDRIISKPFELDALVQTVRDALADRREPGAGDDAGAEDGERERGPRD